MFGRRRRPLLATAVVVGASRSAARREVGRATAGQAQYEQDVEQEAERKRREEEGQEARTQRAVDEALKRAGVAGYADQPPSTAGSSTRPVQQRQSAQAGALPVSVTPQNSPTKPEFQPHPQTLAPVGPQGGDALRTPTPMSLGEEGAIQYCPACGNACQMEDMFCRKCGRKQVRG